MSFKSFDTNTKSYIIHIAQIFKLGYLEFVSSSTTIKCTPKQANCFRTHKNWVFNFHVTFNNPKTKHCNSLTWKQLVLESTAAENQFLYILKQKTF